MYRLIHSVLYCLTIVVLFGHTQSASAQEFSLENKFQEGEVKYLASTVQMDGKTMMGDANLPLKSTTDMGMIFRTKSINDEGIATVELEINKFIMENDMFGQSSIDALKMLNIGGETIEVNVTPSGESTGTESFNSLGLSGLGGQNKNNSMQMPWPKLPKTAVSLGQSWAEEQEIRLGNSSKPIIKSITYTLAEVNEVDGDQIANITTVSKIDAENVQMSNPVAQPGGAEGTVDFNYTFREYKGEGTGSMLFNVNRGELISVSETIQMTIDMGGEVNVNQAGFPSNYRMEYQVKTDSQFLDQVPEND